MSTTTVVRQSEVPGFVNTFTPDGTFTDEAFGKVFMRPKELAIMLQVFGNAFPDMHRELHRFDSVDDMVIVELALQGTQNGPLAMPGGLRPPTGKRMNAPGCDVFGSWTGGSKRSTAIGQHWSAISDAGRRAGRRVRRTTSKDSVPQAGAELCSVRYAQA